MKLPNKYILFTLLAILLLVVYPYYKDYRELKDKQKFAYNLKENENDKVIVSGRTVTHIKRVHLPDGTTRQKIIRKVGVRKVATTVRKDGSIDVYAVQHGPTFEPGISVGYGESARVGIDAELYYWKKWALGGGFDSDVKTFKRVRAHVGIFRDIYLKSFNNSSLYFGVDNTATTRLNFRIRFGGGGE